MSLESLDLSLSDSSLFDSYCFICGELITDFGIKLLDTRTTYMGLPLPDKLCHVIGNKYFIVVSKEDKVCNPCHCLINHLDELEFSLSKTKQKVIQLLEFTHKLDQLVDQNVSVSADVLICNTNFDNCVSSSLEKKTNIDASSCNINEIKALLLPSEKYNETTFFSETPIDNESNVNLKIGHVNKESPVIDSLPVLIDKHEGYNQSYEVCGLDHVIGNDIDERNLVFKEGSPTNNKNLNNSYIDKISTGLHFGDSSVPDISTFEIKAEQINANILPQTHLSVSKVRKSTESNDEILKCEITHDSIGNHPNDNEPIITSTKEKTFVCKICDIPFPKPYLLSRHTRIHQRSSKKVKCVTCDLECHDHLHYLYHRKNDHDLLKRLSCLLCDQNFTSNKELRNHVLTSHEGEQFNCDKCGEKFKRLIQFENHKLYSHGNRNCRVCGKHIYSVVKLRQHENRHAWIDTKKLTCDVCGRVFKTPGGLRVHKVSHTGNYKFFCEFCGRGFMSSVILEEHKGVHTKEERYICDICGRKFVLYSTFHLHKQWHKDPFPFPCNICKKKFRYRSIRSTHIRREHTGENPYKCQYCDAEFLKSVSLKKHITTHTKVYPFSCNNCKKGFDQRRSLARHLARIHNDKSLLNDEPKKCQYKVILRPDEFPVDNEVINVL